MDDKRVESRFQLVWQKLDALDVLNKRILGAIKSNRSFLRNHDSFLRGGVAGRGLLATVSQLQSRVNNVEEYLKEATELHKRFDTTNHSLESRVLALEQALIEMDELKDAITKADKSIATLVASISTFQKTMDRHRNDRQESIRMVVVGVGITYFLILVLFVLVL